jgi:restriction system protein
MKAQPPDQTDSSMRRRAPQSALEQQWAKMQPRIQNGREPELATLLQMVSAGGSITELVAEPGMGKTTMLKMVAELYRQQFGGTVEYVSGGRGFALKDIIDVLADQFRAASGQSLLVIDDADYLVAGDIYETVNRLSTGPWSFSTLVGSRVTKDLGNRITLQPLARHAIMRMVADRLNDAASETVDRVLRASRGIPAFATLLVDGLANGASLTDVERLLEPWRAPGLLGPDGRPLDGRNSGGRKLFTNVRLINSELIDHLSRNPDAVHDLTSRQFEELTAELLERMGYEVQLTAATRDGGKDLYAVRKDGLGSFMFVVECKRYAPDRPVSVGVVRSVHGVAQHERANGAIVMTTSFFTDPAKQFARELRGQMSLRDFADLQGWLSDARRPK